MNFRPELAAKVMSGEKTVTRRVVSDNPRSPWWRERCSYDIGKVFTVNPGRGVSRIGRAVVTALDGPIPLGILTLEEARREGMASPQEFEETISALHGEYDAAALVWRIEFEVYS